MQSRKKILITGGAGFIGSNLARKLLEDGHHVDVVDNLITGRIDSIEFLRSNEHFRFFKLDITDQEFFKTFVGISHDEIYHLACPTGVPNIELYGEEMLKTCSVGTDNVLRLAVTHNSKVVFSSSAEVYGDPEVFPQHEDYTGNVHPTGPRSAYEEGKRFSEALVKSYVDNYKLDAKIVRIFNTFGVGMSPDDSRVIPNFLKFIREGKKIVIYGDGKQTRSHLYIDDLIDGLKIVMENGVNGETYNIGGEKQISIARLAELVSDLVALDVEVDFKPHFIDDHLGRQPDIEKVKNLGWKSGINIADGLSRMITYYGIPLSRVINESSEFYMDDLEVSHKQDIEIIRRDENLSAFPDHSH